MSKHADIAIIGGTGVYDPGLLKNKKEIKVYTPYGDPSDLVTVGTYEDRSVAFIPRHGKGHRIPPHKINSRANIWALKQLGVTRILAPAAVGSMQVKLKPGHIAIPDQFVDFTRSRQYSFYDGGEVCHVSTADPFCPELRGIAIKAGKNLRLNIHDKATYVCIEGPRYSTRAESRFFKDFVKADVIGMTLVPECVLSREAEICYLSIATITDYDVWADRPVSTKEVIETSEKNAQNTRKLLAELIPKIPLKRQRCDCSKALEGAKL